MANRKPVDFKLLVELMEEAKTLSFDQVIAYFSMDEIQMTPAVEKLGYYLGVLNDYTKEKEL